VKKYNQVPNLDVEIEPYEYEKIAIMKTKPRKNNVLDYEKAARKAPWLFKLSAFRMYKPDTKMLLEKCFDFDWSFIESKVEYLIKDAKDIE